MNSIDKNQIRLDNGQDIIKIEIDEATNGEEAVKLFEKNLLKDCQSHVTNSKI